MLHKDVWNKNDRGESIIRFSNHRLELNWIEGQNWNKKSRFITLTVGIVKLAIKELKDILGSRQIHFLQKLTIL